MYLYVVLNTFKVAIDTVQFMGFVSELILSRVPVHNFAFEDAETNRSLHSIRAHLEQWSARLESSLAKLSQTTHDADNDILDIAKLSHQCKGDCDELVNILRELIADGTPSRSWDNFYAAIESTQGKQFVVLLIGKHQARQRMIGSRVLVLFNCFCSAYDTESNHAGIRRNSSSWIQQINVNLDKLRRKLSLEYGRNLSQEPVLLEIKNLLETLARDDATDARSSAPPSVDDNENHENHIRQKRQKRQGHRPEGRKRSWDSVGRTLVNLIVALLLFFLGWINAVTASRTSERSNTTSRDILVSDNLVENHDEQDPPELAYTYNVYHDPIKFSCLPELVDCAVSMLPKCWRSREPPVPPGKGRVHWICGGCGLCLYDDFSGLTPESLKDMENELRLTNNAQPPTRLNGSFSDWIPTFRDLKQGIRIILRGWRSNRNTSLPLHTAQQSQTQNLSTASKILYILYCVHASRTGIRFHQERLHNICTDKELLSFLKAQYQHHRNTLSWFRLRHVSKVMLNRFEVDLSHFAQIHRHDCFCSSANCVFLPPTDKIDDEYTCGPAPQKPPKQFPVFGENYLIHYFKNPQCLSEKQKTIFRQLPKRTCGRLCVSDDEEQPTFGWGIYFEEVFGIAWSMSKGDVQGAFAISSYWVTLGSLFLGYVAVRSS
ncbi:hypothetical protein M434DRAFT_173935 [Hypoxylon sp. CO27-5]|nr:hypothetical protein M434DRAFT_173935 [Hypoxylon sp. CO27-5]